MKTKINNPLLVGILSLLSVFSGSDIGGLKEITKPYLGVYECTEARFSQQDYLTRFDKIELELKADETFTLYYCEKGGCVHKETGRYRYDPEQECIMLDGSIFKRKFPLKEGTLTLYFTIGKEVLTLRFEQKS